MSTLPLEDLKEEKYKNIGGTSYYVMSTQNKTLTSTKIKHTTHTTYIKRAD